MVCFASRFVFLPRFMAEDTTLFGIRPEQAGRIRPSKAGYER
jgi:hypothetical protein